MNSNVVGDIVSDIDANKGIYKYNWTISADDFYKTRKRLRSPKLTPINNSEFDWQLWLYPRGMQRCLMGDVAISLYNFSNKVVTAAVSFGVINFRGEVINVKIIEKKTYNTKRVSQANWKFEKFLERKFIDIYKKEVFYNGFLTIQCEIKTYEVDTSEVIGEEEDAEYSYGEDDSIDEDEERLKHLNKYEDLLMNDDILSDITFIVDGQIVYAHKCILAKSSLVFSAMFKREVGLTRKIETLIVEDIDYDAFVEMLRFVYTGKLDVEFTNDNVKSVAEDLLIAAGKYCVHGLKDACVKLMSECVWIDNVVEIIKLADRQQLKLLKSKAMGCIVLHSNDIDQIVDFDTLTETPNLLCEICRSIANKKIFF